MMPDDIRINNRKTNISMDTVKRTFTFLTRISPLLAFIIPMLILYSLDPGYFEKTWQGRTYQLFFLWLLTLEMILSWEELQAVKINKVKSIRTIAFVVSLSIPTVYVIAANFFGLNAVIYDLAIKSNVGEHWALLMPLSTEYLVFAELFALIIFLGYGISGLKNYSTSVFFLGIIGGVYTIDNLYPFGRFTPFQAITPTTTRLAANVLNLLGYKTLVLASGYIPTLIAWDPQNPLRIASFGIAWPCSGVESLIIYTVAIVLFLSKSAISWKRRIIYFGIGAAVTYFINILRIVSIYLIAMDYGYPSPEVQRFHDYYGQLYSIIWIVSYPLIIIGSRALWTKIRNRQIGAERSRTADLLKGKTV